MSYTTLISTHDLAQHIQSAQTLVIDCRFDLMDTEIGREDYLESHLPGAIYADLNKDLSGEIVAGKTGRHPLPDVEKFCQKLSQWGVDNSIQVIAYDDRGGAMAARLWWLLQWMGHDKAAVLDGGWNKWVSEGRNTSSSVPQREARKFSVNIQTQLSASVNDVLNAINDDSIKLLDARASDRFRGENETLDNKAGHIPGAINVPFIGNLNDEGCFLSPQALQSRYESILGSTPGRNSIVYCGSGVTAAHDILAMKVAGISDARLYAGSWSHWITNDKHPIATGD